MKSNGRRIEGCSAGLRGRQHAGTDGNAFMHMLPRGFNMSMPLRDTFSNDMQSRHGTVFSSTHKPFINASVCLVALTVMPLFTLLFGLPIALRAADEKAPNRTDDLVAFFKRAINSPPDVEHFIACQQVHYPCGMPPEIAAELTRRGVNAKKPQPPFYFEGALSGGNFYVFDLTNAIGGFDPRRLVTGRAGSNSYQIGFNVLRRTQEDAEAHPENPVARWSKGQYNLINQLFQMGIGGLKAGTVVWDGNEFTAESDGRVTMYGELVISNGLPFALKVSTQKGGLPYEILNYVYPDPPFSLQGYPRKIVRTMLSEGRWQPCDEFTLFEIQLAEHPLGEEFFREAQFVTTNVQLITVYSNGAFFAILPEGKAVKTPLAGDRMAEKPWSPVHRVIILCALGFLTLIFWVTVCRNLFLNRKRQPRKGEHER